MAMQRANKTNQSELAREIGVKPQTIQYLSTKGKGSEYAADLARALKCSYDWLSKGIGEIDDLGVNEIPPVYHKPPQPAVPVVGMAQLGPEGFWEETQHPVGYGDGVILWPSSDSNAYALRCVGDSMSPRIKHGEFVVIEPNHTIVAGDEVMVRTDDGRSMIKVFLYERDDRIHLDSINNGYGQITLDKRQITKFHYVAGIAKQALLRK